MRKLDPEVKKARAQERSRKWYLANKERALKQQKEYYNAHKEQTFENNKRWAAEHPELVKQYKKKWKDENKDYTKQAMKEYHARTRAQREETKRAWRLANPDKVAAIRERTLAKNPAARRARIKVTTALALGKLIKASFCSQCGSSENVQAHHHLGYSARHALDVIWLCHKCHVKQHYETIGL